MREMSKLKVKIKEFVEERKWDQFHAPKNLCMALSGEMGELNEIFQWLSIEESYLKKSSNEYSNAQEELSDIFIYLILICEKLDIDLIDAAFDKIEINRKKYPIESSENSAKKYNELYSQ